MHFHDRTKWLFKIKIQTLGQNWKIKKVDSNFMNLVDFYEILYEGDFRGAEHDVGVKIQKKQLKFSNF